MDVTSTQEHRGCVFYPRNIWCSVFSELKRLVAGWQKWPLVEADEASALILCCVTDFSQLA